MGFMDKLKGMSETAGAAMRMPTSEDMAYAQRAQRLHQVGVEVPAVLNSLEPTGQKDMSGAEQYRFDVTVTRPDGSTTAGTFTQYLLAGQLGAWTTPGSAVRVKIDPDDPSAMLWMGAG
jgi:hypothetical protein